MSSAERQIPLFEDDRDDAPVTRRRDAEAWTPVLTQRVRVLLHTAPLHAIHRGDALRDPAFRHYDALALAMKALDTIVDRMGLEEEADREDVARALSPILRAADQAADVPESGARHAAMVERVLAGLRNDEEARRPFRSEYMALDDDGAAVRHHLEYRLVSDAFHPSGRTVLRLSNEGVNLYLRLLDIDIEDAQAAAEAVVHSQLARGRFDEAVASAEHARLQSVRYRRKIREVLRDTRRDVDRVDWLNEVPRLLDDSIRHLVARLDAEQSILDAAEERLDVMEGDDTPRRAVVRVADLIRDCRLRHVELHQELMQARNVFLDAQARQAFAPTPAPLVPELLGDVLGPLLGLPRADASRVTAAAVPLLLGAHPPAQVSLATLVPWLVAPRRGRLDDVVAAPPPDFSEPHEELQRFPPALRSRADRLVESLEGRAALSQVLASARAEGEPREVLELLVMYLLQEYAPDDAGPRRLRVERWDGVPLADEAFHGDDLVVLALEAPLEGESPGGDVRADDERMDREAEG